MWDSRVHVGGEIVLQSLKRVPEGCGAVVDQLDLHDGLDTLEPVFLGNNQADRSAMLLG